MNARVTWLSVLAALALASTACGDKGGEKKDDGKAEGEAAKGDDGKGEPAAGDEGEPTLQVAENDQEVEGPVPPETSMVFFQVEGALLPLACFDKDAGAMKGGPDCLDLVPAGAEARVSGGDLAFNKKTTEREVPRCLPGSTNKIALGAEELSGGAEFTYGAWPPSGLKILTRVSEETTQPEATQLDDDVKATLSNFVPAKGELQAYQVAEIDVDGNDTKDMVYSVFVPHPTMAEQYAWSGLFLAPDGNLESKILVAQSRSRKDVFEVKGVLDLDGANTSELWVRMMWEDGSGDAVFELKGATAEPLAKWSCGG